MNATRAMLVAVGAAALLASSCREKKRTEVLLGLATDLAAPTPLRLVHMDVSHLPDGIPIGQQDFSISGEVNNVYELPGTYAVYSANGTPDRIGVRLTAFDDQGGLLIVRTAVLSLVPQKTLFVRLGVVSACQGMNDCPSGQTCIEGRCASEIIDTSRLSDYVPGTENQLQCAGGTRFVDTSTKVALPLAPDAACDKGTCQDGTCLAPVPGAFTSTKGPLTTNRSASFQIGDQLVTLNDGRVLLAGGLGPGSVPVLTSAEVYDPKQQTFMATGGLAVARTYFGEAKLKDGRVLIVGGINEGGAALASAEIYDPAAGAFAPTRMPMTVPRTFPAAATLADGRVLIVGGVNQIQSYAAGIVMYFGGLTSAEIYDPATDAFAPLASGLVEGRAFSTILPLANGDAVVLCGGAQDAVVRTTVEIFHASAGAFGATPVPLPSTEGCDPNGVLPDGRVLVSTGNVAWFFDPATGKFANAAVHPAGKRGEFAGVLADGNVLFAGNAAMRDGYLFDPASKSFAFVTGEMSVARRGFTSAHLLDDGILVVGGDAAGTSEIFRRPGDRAAAPATSTGTGGAKMGAGGRGGATGGAGGAGGTSSSTGGATAGSSGGGGTAGSSGIAGRGGGAGGALGTSTGGQAGGPGAPGGAGGRSGVGPVAGTGGAGGVTGPGAGGAGGARVRLAPDTTGWIDASTNSFGIHGYWFVWTDGVGPDGVAANGGCEKVGGFAPAQCSSVTTPVATAQAPFPNDGEPLCTSGVAARVLDGADGLPDYTNIFGGGIGFALNQIMNGDITTIGPFDAVAAGVKGISFDIDRAPPALRVEVTTPATQYTPAYWAGATSQLSPVVAGTNTFRWSDITGPMYLAAPPPFDPTSTQLVQLHVITNATAATPYSFCVSNVKVLTQ